MLNVKLYKCFQKIIQCTICGAYTFSFSFFLNMFQGHYGLKRELKVMIITSKYTCLMIKARKCFNAFRKYYYRENVSLLFKIFNQKLEFCDNTCFMPLNCGNIADTTLHSIKPVNLVLCFVIIRILWIS